MSKPPYCGVPQHLVDRVLLEQPVGEREKHHRGPPAPGTTRYLSDQQGAAAVQGRQQEDRRQRGDRLVAEQELPDHRARRNSPPAKSSRWRLGLALLTGSVLAPVITLPAGSAGPRRPAAPHRRSRMPRPRGRPHGRCRARVGEQQSPSLRPVREAPGGAGIQVQPGPRGARTAHSSLERVSGSPTGALRGRLVSAAAISPRAVPAASGVLYSPVQCHS